jgi:hypothetical protein
MKSNTFTAQTDNLISNNFVFGPSWWGFYRGAFAIPNSQQLPYARESTQVNNLVSQKRKLYLQFLPQEWFPPALASPPSVLRCDILAKKHYET